MDEQKNEDWANKLSAELASGEVIHQTCQPDSSFKSMNWIVLLGIAGAAIIPIYCSMRHMSIMVILVAEAALAVALYVLFCGLQFEFSNLLYVITNKRILVMKKVGNQQYIKDEELGLDKIVKIDKDDFGDGTGRIQVVTTAAANSNDEGPIGLEISGISKPQEVYDLLTRLTNKTAPSS